MSDPIVTFPYSFVKPT